MNRLNASQSISPLENCLSAKMIIMLGLLLLGMMSASHAHSAWFDNFVAQEATYKVKESDGEETFTISDYIYDARSSCELAVGDRVMFSEGRYGIDYRATVYSMNSQQRCELLLRDPVS